MVKSIFLVAKMPRTCPSRCPVARNPEWAHGRGAKMDPGGHAHRETVNVPWSRDMGYGGIHLFGGAAGECFSWNGEVLRCFELFQNREDSLDAFCCETSHRRSHFWIYLTRVQVSNFTFIPERLSSFLRYLNAACVCSCSPCPAWVPTPPSFQHPRYRNYILGSSPLQLHFIQSDPKTWQDFCPSISISNTRSTSSTSGRLLCGLFPTSLQHSTAGAPCKSQGTASPCAVAWHSAFAKPGPATSPVLGPRGAGAAASHVATSGAVGLQAAANAPAATVGGWGGGTAPAAASHTGARQVESNACWVQWQQAPHGCREIDGWGEREHHREEGGAKGRRTPPEPLAATHDRLQPAFHSIAPEITSCVHRAHQAAARRVVATTSTNNFFGGTKTTDAKTNWRPSRAENSHDSPIGRFRSYKPHIHRCRTWKVHVQVTTRKRAITLGIPDEHTWHTWHTWTRALQPQGHKARQQPGFRSPIFKIQMTSDDIRWHELLSETSKDSEVLSISVRFVGFALAEAQAVPLHRAKESQRRAKRNETGDSEWDDQKGSRIRNDSSGWWFGTFVIFPYIGNNHPNWRTHIFQRGRYTANQFM